MKGFLYLVYLYFTIGNKLLSQQKDVARPEFELTSPFKKSTEVRVVDSLNKRMWPDQSSNSLPHLRSPQKSE